MSHYYQLLSASPLNRAIYHAKVAHTTPDAQKEHLPDFVQASNPNARCDLAAPTENVQGVDLSVCQADAKIQCWPCSAAGQREAQITAKRTNQSNPKLLHATGGGASSSAVHGLPRLLPLHRALRGAATV